MGIGDLPPSGGGTKRPLTKKELAEMKKRFAQAEAIIRDTQEKEAKEKTLESTDIDELLNLAP